MLATAVCNFSVLALCRADRPRQSLNIVVTSIYWIYLQTALTTQTEWLQKDSKFFENTVTDLFRILGARTRNVFLIVLDSIL